MTELLSVVIAFRDRDLERAERCLSSLAAQSFEGFELILVDYGSAQGTASALRSLVARLGFCRLIYSDTLGQPWNRSRALNIGVRRSTAAFVMTSDIDMIFSGGFLAALAERLHNDRVVYCSPRLLPEGFEAWNDVERFEPELRPAGKSARAGNGCLRRSPLRAELGNRTNLVHAYLAELTHDDPERPGPVADYYLEFPSGEGIDLLVRA